VDPGPDDLFLHDVAAGIPAEPAVPAVGVGVAGLSKERRLEPRITIGLLTDAAGFPVMVNAFEGNKAETTTMLPVIQAFMKAHQLPDVTVVVDAGMVSAANQQAIEAAGLSFILGARVPEVPCVVAEWRKARSPRRLGARCRACPRSSPGWSSAVGCAAPPIRPTAATPWRP
jgi:hypothetical protein